jgi:ABC-2 type transport system permease protein
MRTVVILMRRELYALFVSPMAYFLLTASLLLNGYFFSDWVIPGVNGVDPQYADPIGTFFGNSIFLWILIMFFAPAVTMRLLADEKHSGTFETLVTSPITELQIVLGKYLSALFFYIVLWLPTVGYMIWLSHVSNPDCGAIVSSYIGILLIGQAFLAIGLLCSSLTQYQNVAAVTCFVVISLLFLLGLKDLQLDDGDMFKPITSYMNLWSYMDAFSRGVIDTRVVVYLLSIGWLALYATVRSLESRKWR